MLNPAEIEAVLRRHVLDVWFPRCIDRELGGYRCDFDRAWASAGPQTRLLEFQARQMMIAAHALAVFPENEGLRDAALHGFRYLRDTMWDREHGGWYHLLSSEGEPLEAMTKHVHGFAYAITACAVLYETTGDAEALRCAQQGFEWMDAHARDREHGGYFGFLLRDGRVIQQPGECPWKSELDTVGTEIGLKDLNVHSDLVETLAVLYRAWPVPIVEERLREMIDIVTDRMINPATGAMHFFVTPDWRPLPHLIRTGYQCHSAYRVLLAAEVTGQEARYAPIARRMIDNAVRYAEDLDVGGFFYAAPGVFPIELHQRQIQVRAKVWWVQSEALRGLMAVARATPDDERYARALERTWAYFRRYFVDDRFGGVYSYGLDSVRVWQRKLGARLAPGVVTRKGDIWKDASHEGRALLFCLESLRATPA